jgi:hypothetical protein
MTRAYSLGRTIVFSALAVTISPAVVYSGEAVLIADAAVMRQAFADLTSQLNSRIQSNEAAVQQKYAEALGPWSGLDVSPGESLEDQWHAAIDGAAEFQAGYIADLIEETTTGVDEIRDAYNAMSFSWPEVVIIPPEVDIDYLEPPVVDIEFLAPPVFSFYDNTDFNATDNGFFGS